MGDYVSFGQAELSRVLFSSPVLLHSHIEEVCFFPKSHQATQAQTHEHTDACQAGSQSVFGLSVFLLLLLFLSILLLVLVDLAAESSRCLVSSQGNTAQQLKCHIGDFGSAP